MWRKRRLWRVVWAGQVRLRWDGDGRRLYANVLLCPGRRNRHCVTITLLLPGQFETQRSCIPSSSSSASSRAPASGLCVSVMKEVRGTGEEGAWLRARDARKGFPDDMAQLWTMHSSMYRRTSRGAVCVVLNFNGAAAADDARDWGHGPPTYVLRRTTGVQRRQPSPTIPPRCDLYTSTWPSA